MIKIKVKIIYILIFCLCFSCSSGTLIKEAHNERYYQEKWCAKNKGKTEVVMPDRTRCDCITATHAIEFDFAPKWAEAIGQSLLYSAHTGKKAGIVLILTKEKEERFAKRIQTAIKPSNTKIDLWLLKDYKK